MDVNKSLDYTIGVTDCTNAKNEQKINFNWNGFESLCSLSQIGVMALIRKSIYKFYEEKDVIFTDKYIICKGKAPVMFCAHMDTVKRDDVKIIISDKEKGYITSPNLLGGDDRCGVYTLLTLIVYSSIKPWVIFTTDEEIGCIGATEAVKDLSKEMFSDIKFMVEIDRRGSNDCVFYQCDNKDFHKWIQDNTGYVKNTGSSSDCRHLGKGWDIASVNLSAGYYNEHNKHEYVVVKELCRTIETCFKLLNLSLLKETPSFDYQATGYYGSHNYVGYSGYYDGFDSYYGSYKTTKQELCDRNKFFQNQFYKSQNKKNDKTHQDVFQIPCEEKIIECNNELLDKFNSMSDSEIDELYKTYKDMLK